MLSGVAPIARLLVDRVVERHLELVRKPTRSDGAAKPMTFRLVEAPGT